MTTAGETVLVVHANCFRADYVADVLAARGIAVRTVEEEAALRLIEAGTPGIRAIVWGEPLRPEALRRIDAELRRHPMPCLLLLDDGDAADVPAGIATLASPLAAYQIADWVAAVADAPTLGCSK